MRFSNNREVGARDFKASFERVLYPGTKSPNIWVFDKVEGAEAYRKGLSQMWADSGLLMIIHLR